MLDSLIKLIVQVTSRPNKTFVLVEKILSATEKYKESGNASQLRRIAATVDSETFRQITEFILNSWVGRRYEHVLPIITQFIERDKWIIPVTQILKSRINEGNGWRTAYGIVGLAPLLPPELLDKAIQAANEFPFNDGHADVMVGLLPYIPDEQKDNWFSKSLEVAETTVDKDDKAVAFAILAGYAKPEEKDLVTSKALLAIREANQGEYSESAFALSILEKHSSPKFSSEIDKLKSEIKRGARKSNVVGWQ
jgi:hypothetical protein